MVRDSSTSSSSYGIGGGGGGGVMMPAWLRGLVEETFFSGCSAHENKKKNEKNIFCLALECCRSICPHCASSPSHHSHPILQVRRYVYNDVVRLDDLEKLIDCSCVQPYTINSAKVVFLKQRPQSRHFKGSGNICLTCDRILQEPFHFCSLSCKVDHVVLQGQDLSSILYRFNESDLAFSNLESLQMDGGGSGGGGGGGSDFLMLEDEGQITPDSILEVPLHYTGCSGGSSNGGGSKASSGSSEGGGCGVAANKKKKGGGFLPQIVLSLGNRRKGAPHRSPLS